MSENEAWLRRCITALMLSPYAVDVRNAEAMTRALDGLLEEHRKAIHEAEAQHRQAIASEKSRLSGVLEKLREALVAHGESCAEGGLVGVLNGIERALVAARNEGLERVATKVGDLVSDWHRVKESVAWKGSTIREFLEERIRAMKEGP